MDERSLLAVAGILDGFTQLDTFVAARQRMADELRQLGELVYCQIIDLRAFYANKAWDNIVSVNGYDPKPLEKAHRYYVGTNPIVPLQPKLKPEQCVFRHSDLVGDHTWLESEFIRDFCRHYDMCDGVNLLMYDPDGALRWGMGSGHRKLRGVKKEFVQLLRLMGPAFSRALSNSERWHAQLGACHSMSLILESVQDALALVQPRKSSGGPKLLEATPAACAALGVHGRASAANPSLGSFLEASSRALKRPVHWTDARGRQCRLSAISTRARPGENPALLVRMEPLTVDALHDGEHASPERENGRAARLSPREALIIRDVSRGLGDKQIAYAMNISIHTIRTHLRRIYKKLGVSGRIAAVNAAANLHKN